MATPRSSSDGCVRPRISLGSEYTVVKFCKPMNVTTIDVPIAMRTPAAITAALDSRIFISASESAAAVARIGVMRGATSIAPMITATLFAASPKAARRVDSTIRTKNRARCDVSSPDSQNNSSVTRWRSSSDIMRRDGRSPSSICPRGESAVADFGGAGSP